MAQEEPPGIVVGVDGSDPARRALDWALTEAELRKLPLYVVSAAPAPSGAASLAPGAAIRQEDIDASLDSVRATTQEMLDEAKASRGSGRTIDTRVQIYSGTATEVLLGLSERHVMIVVGSRGAGGFSRLLLGSVSTAVVHHSACPVLVVRK